MAVTASASGRGDGQTHGSSLGDAIVGASTETGSGFVTSTRVPFTWGVYTCWSDHLCTSITVDQKSLKLIPQIVRSYELVRPRLFVENLTTS